MPRVLFLLRDRQRCVIFAVVSTLEGMHGHLGLSCRWSLGEVLSKRP